MTGRELTIDQRARPPQAHRGRVTDPGRTVLVIPKVQKFLEALVAGEPIKDAAKASGIRVNRARRLFDDPAVRREFHRRCDAILEGERARNMLVQQTIRDRGLAADASAAQQKVSLEATHRLQPSDSSSITINGPTVIAGYVIRLDGPAEGPRRIDRAGGPSRDAEDI